MRTVSSVFTLLVCLSVCIACVVLFVELDKVNDRMRGMEWDIEHIRKAASTKSSNDAVIPTAMPVSAPVSSIKKWTDASRWRLLRQDMTASEVEQLIGKAAAVSFENGVAVWRFDNDSSASFFDGRLITWSGPKQDKQ